MRPPFLTSPGAYVRTQRTRQEPADANPFRKFERPSRAERTASVLLAVVIGVLLALALVHWWAS